MVRPFSSLSENKYDKVLKNLFERPLRERLFFFHSEAALSKNYSICIACLH